MKYFQGFSLAFNMLTILPFFKVHNFFKGINGYSAMFYPLVGFIIGSLLFGFYTSLEGIVPDTHLSVMIFFLWVLLTGALHLDGFSDTVDGLFVDKKKSLSVMKDSHVGGMGMVFSFIFLIFKLSSLIHLDSYYLLPIILMVSRLNATLAIYFYPYISGGVGKLIKDELRLKYTIFAFLYSLIITYIFSSIMIFIFSFITLFLISKFFVKRLDGLNGDIYGFIIESTEVVILNYIIISGVL